MTAMDAGPLADPAVERGEGRPPAYYLANKERVPSCSTISSRFADKGGLLFWAFQRGKDGADELYDDTTALDVGKIVHSTIEAELNGDPVPLVPARFAKQVGSSLEAWHEWWESNSLTVIATEIPLVSEVHKFGGTLDGIVRDRHGRLAIGDWKSSKALYRDYLIQIAGYRILWNENRDEQITGGFHLVRFSKEHGDMEHRYFPDLADAERLFLVFREAYELDKQLKKRVR